MGKIRIQQIGVPEMEKAQKEQGKKRREAKKAKKKIRAPGLKGGERVVAVGPTEEEIEAMELPKEEPEPSKPSEPSLPSKPSKPSPLKKKTRSCQYKRMRKMVDKDKAYSIKEAIKLLRKVSFARFNGTVEAHLNVSQENLSGQVFLPHGTGKELKIAIADEKLIQKLENGKIDFDILLATPKMMPKLGKFGKLLGPKGLMPNPKAGTVTEEPEKKAKELKKGQTFFKTERKVPLIHLVFGKMNFKDNQLIENFNALVTAIGPSKIEKAVIKSTMSPGIKVKFD